MLIKIIFGAEIFFTVGHVLSDMQIRTSKACFASQQPNSIHSLDCGDQKIAIMDAYYTYNAECDNTLPATFSSIPENLDRTVFGPIQLRLVNERCTSQPNCISEAQTTAQNRFSVLKYQCIDDDNEINSCTGERKSGCFVSLFFAEKSSCTCFVTSKTIAASGKLDFYLLGMELIDKNCASLKFYIGGQMRSNNCTKPLTPYRLLVSGIHKKGDDTKVIMNNSAQDRIWILIKGSESFSVTCSSHGIPSLGPWQSSTNGPDQETCNTLTTAKPGQSATIDTVANTGAVAGGVTAAVLVILIVVLLLLWFKCKRNQNSESRRYIGKTPVENSSVAAPISDHNYHEIETIKPKKSVNTYDYATVAGEVNHPGQEGQSPSEERSDNISDKRQKETVRPDNENEDDYNYLASIGESKTIENGVHPIGYDTAVSASKSVQQIRNNEVSNVDNDCDYNHIDSNSKPKPLQCDYDTTASASKAVAQMMETDEQTEDDYDHFRLTKAWSQAADSPYDTAEHHAEHSGDYSIAGVIQKNDPYDLAK